MVYGFDRYRDTYPADTNILVAAHAGDKHAMLRRYEIAADIAVAEGRMGIRRIGPKLFKWVADTRNLRVAWDLLKKYGGTARGPNGLTYSDLSDSEVWELLRTLSKAILKRTYRPGPDRAIRIPKGSGRGYRTLRLQNVEDRVVARAIVQILQPLLDVGFDENSFGFRPHLDRRHALAKAITLSEIQGRMVWLLEDVKDAFDQVPIQRLLNIVRKRLPEADGLWALIETVLDNGTTRGLRQGSPLSPLLLNLYLDHFLDRIWRHEQPDTTLIRSADDLVVLCPADQEALEAREHLRRITSSARLPLKDTNQAIRNLNTCKADWLGYSVSMGDEGLRVRISAKSWSKLEEKLSLVHKKPAAPLRANEIVLGWIEQIGPCYPHEDRDQAISRIAELGRQIAFDELPDAEYLETRWRESYSRWLKILQITSSSVSSSSSTLPDYSADRVDGSADPHVFCAALRRSDGAPISGAPSLSLFLSRGDRVTLHADGCCLPSRVGGWGVIVESPSLRDPLRGSGAITRTTNNRAELLAVINGLEQITVPCNILVSSDSKYVVDGISAGLAKWKSQGWRAGTKKHKRDLKNIDLWQRLDALIQVHEEVVCHWVRGHSGQSENEQCDHLAQLAAHQREQRLG